MAALLFCGQVTFFLLFVYSFPTNPMKPCYRCEAPNSQCTPVMYERSIAAASLRTADAFPVVASLPPSDDRKCVCGSLYRWLVITHVVLVYIDQVALHWRWIFEEYWSNIYLIRLNYMQIIIIIINIFIIVVVIIVINCCCCYDYQERVRGWSLMFHNRSLLLIITWFSNAVTFRTSISMPLQTWSPGGR